MIITVYIEYVFIMSFIMNYIVLYITGLIIGTGDIHVGTGSFIASIIYIGIVSILGVNTVASIIGGIMGMSLAVFKVFSPASLKEFLLRMFPTLIVTLLTGMVMGGFLSYTYGGYVLIKILKENGNLISFVILVFYAGILFKSLIKGVIYLKRRLINNLRAFNMTLRYNNKILEGKGLIDSGNNLYYGQTNEPVSIVEYDLIKTLLNEPPKGLFTINYQSLGQDRGIMYGVVFDEMIITLPNGQVSIRKPYIGIYKGKMCANGEYNMILHKDYIDRI